MTSKRVLTSSMAGVRRTAAGSSLRRAARAALPVLATAVIIGLLAVPAMAQGVPEPSSTPIDTIVTKLRNFMITVLMPLVAALAVVWAAFLLYQGGREGMGNMLKVVGATLAALGAVGLVELLKAFANGQAR